MGPPRRCVYLAQSPFNIGKPRFAFGMWTQSLEIFLRRSSDTLHFYFEKSLVLQPLKEPFVVWYQESSVK